VREDILGADVGEDGFGAVTSGIGAGAGFTSGPEIVSTEPNVFESTSVPSPSFARTAASPMESVAVPACFARNVMVSSVPFEPLNPGFGTPPLKDTVPAPFEKDGSESQSEKIESDLLTEIAWSMSVGNEITPSALFIGVPWAFTTARTVTMSPTVTAFDAGVSDIVAALAEIGERARRAATRSRCFILYGCGARQRPARR
jgi:hypothetical protein